MCLAEVERCFNKGLLQKRGKSIDLARKSIRQADIFLKDAGKLIDSDMTRMSVLALYNAFFHAARALLFKDGIKERSHFCVARYVESEYVLNNRLDENSHSSIGIPSPFSSSSRDLSMILKASASKRISKVSDSATLRLFKM